MDETQRNEMEESGRRKCPWKHKETGLGEKRMKGEKKEMPKKIKNKKTWNETQKDDYLRCLSRWRSCHELGCGLAHLTKPTREAVPAPNSCRQLMLTNCHATNSFGSCNPLPLEYTWPLPIAKQIWLMFPLFRSSLQKTADARSTCASFPNALPHNKIFGPPGFGQNCFIFWKWNISNETKTHIKLCSEGAKEGGYLGETWEQTQRKFNTVKFV